MQAIRKNIHKLPDAPGVYFFMRGRRTLYIGKATSLKERVRSYFSSDIVKTRGPLIVKMLEEATGVTYRPTDSVLEALILETALIKKHQPPYNVREKSDKSFNYVVITDESFPRVFTVRERELLKAAEAKKLLQLQATYGPFPNGSQLREALKIIRKIFPFRGKTDPAFGKRRGVSRLNEELGLVPRFGTENVSARDYRRTVRNLKTFFEGKKAALVRSLERDMKAYVLRREFEKAAAVRTQLFALRHIQDVALLKGARPERENSNFRVEGYDIAHILETGRVGVMVVIENGEPDKDGYRKFKIRTKNTGDIAALKEVMERRFAHSEWQLPRLIVVDGGTAQRRAAEKALSDFGYEIPIVAVTKDERHRPKYLLGSRSVIAGREDAILLANNEAHRFAVAYHRRKRILSTRGE